MSLTLSWNRTAEGKWPDLSTANLSNPEFQNQGVYIIWHGGNSPEIVSVGQGKLSLALQEELRDTKVLGFQGQKLFMACAAVEESQQAGVRQFLIQKLTPKVTRTVPEAEPVAVNMPWKKN